MVLLAAGGLHHAYPDLNSLPIERRLDSVSPYLELVAVILLPTALGYGAVALVRGFKWAGMLRDRHRSAPEPEPIDRLAGNLRRLRAQLEDMETRSDVPAKHLRLRALRGAYVDALSTACRRLEADPPSGEHASQAEIYRVEAELRQHGLDVREPVNR
jgi:hypothetical protein